MGRSPVGEFQVGSVQGQEGEDQTDATLDVAGPLMPARDRHGEVLGKPYRDRAVGPVVAGRDMQPQRLDRSQLEGAPMLPGYARRS